MNKTYPSVAERAQGLVSTSVDDLHSSLPYYQGIDPFDVETIKHGLKICQRRGEKTKATMLRRKLKKMEKERLRAIYLSLLAEVDDA